MASLLLSLKINLIYYLTNNIFLLKYLNIHEMKYEQLQADTP